MATCSRSRMMRCVLSAALIVLGAGAAGAESASKAPSDLQELYEQAIYDSAVKRPSFNRLLMPIPASEAYVTVQTLRTKELPVEDPSPFGPRERDLLRLKRINAERGVLLGNIFVALPKEARRLCKGAADPLLALQQGLGLPPKSDPDYRIVRFRVARADMFRPCASGPDVGAPKCSFDVPQDLDPAGRRLHQGPTPYRGLPELQYPMHDRDVLVTACGRLCMHRKKINISTVLAGQRLGIKEVGEGIWLVSFMTYDFGFVDLEQRTLQPLDNPFGTRLSPIS
jgi:hypothetical protein